VISSEPPPTNSTSVRHFAQKFQDRNGEANDEEATGRSGGGHDWGVDGAVRPCPCLILDLIPTQLDGSSPLPFRLPLSGRRFGVRVRVVNHKRDTTAMVIDADADAGKGEKSMEKKPPCMRAPYRGHDLGTTFVLFCAADYADLFSSSILYSFYQKVSYFSSWWLWHMLSSALVLYLILSFLARWLITEQLWSRIRFYNYIFSVVRFVKCWCPDNFNILVVRYHMAFPFLFFHILTLSHFRSLIFDDIMSFVHHLKIIDIKTRKIKSRRKYRLARDSYFLLQGMIYTIQSLI
jgi:hypothetical protein